MNNGFMRKTYIEVYTKLNDFYLCEKTKNFIFIFIFIKDAALMLP